MKRVITVATVALVLVGSAGAYPKPQAKYLAKPFTGIPVPNALLGQWRETNTTNDGVICKFFAKSSAACKALVAGRTSCFTLTPPGADWFDGGAITMDGSKVVLRMTYRGHARTVGCFTDDPYPFTLHPKQILIFAADSASCFWQKSVERFPVHLDATD